VPAVTIKLPVVAPAAIVTDDGIVSAALLSEIATAVAPEGAAVEIVTVHVEVAPDTTVAGEHATAETAVITGIVTLMLPPVADTDPADPSGIAAMTLLSGSATDELVPVALRFTMTVASTPEAIGVVFMPLTRHLTVPLPVLQSTVFPAAKSPDDAVVLTDAISLAGSESVHSTPDGAFPELASDRFKSTELPRTAEPEDSVITLCAGRLLDNSVETIGTNIQHFGR